MVQSPEQQDGAEHNENDIHAVKGSMSKKDKAELSNMFTDFDGSTLRNLRKSKNEEAKHKENVFDENQSHKSLQSTKGTKISRKGRKKPYKNV